MNGLIFKRKDKNVLLITCIFFKNKRKRLHNYQLHSRYSPKQIIKFHPKALWFFYLYKWQPVFDHAQDLVMLMWSISILCFVVRKYE